jgi:hypothetical protein
MSKDNKKTNKEIEIMQLLPRQTVRNQGIDPAKLLLLLEERQEIKNYDNEVISNTDNTIPMSPPGGTKNATDTLMKRHRRHSM